MKKKLSILGVVLLIASVVAVFWFWKGGEGAREIPIKEDVEEGFFVLPEGIIDSGDIEREDPDRDDLTNEEEKGLGTDPENPDTDGDGLRDGDEVFLGTKPLISDTDGDGFEDAVELKSGYNPLGEGKLEE